MTLAATDKAHVLGILRRTGHDDAFVGKVRDLLDAAPAQQAGAPLPLAPDRNTVLEEVAVRLEYEELKTSAALVRALKTVTTQQATLPASEAVNVNGEPATALSMLESLIDIYDDAQTAAPEDRCYVEGAWPDVLDCARKFIATRAQPQADAAEDHGR